MGISSLKQFLQILKRIDLSPGGCPPMFPLVRSLVEGDFEAFSMNRSRDPYACLMSFVLKKVASSLFHVGKLNVSCPAMR
jgi:hypothetical protein